MIRDVPIYKPMSLLESGSNRSLQAQHHAHFNHPLLSSAFSVCSSDNVMVVSPVNHQENDHDGHK